MLSNAYFLAKFRFDTAENEPAKNLQNFRKMHFRKMHFRKMHFRKMHFRKCILAVALAAIRAESALESHLDLPEVADLRATASLGDPQPRTSDFGDPQPRASTAGSPPTVPELATVHVSREFHGM